jgi:hypothetical protein
MTDKALTNKQLAELTQMMAEFQGVMVEANAAVTKLLKVPANADLNTPEGKAAFFTLVVGLGELSADDVLGVALAGMLALLRMHRQPKLRLTDIFPGLLPEQPA